MKYQLPNSFEIEYFLEASRALNFSRAAERLGVTQPSLSLAIQRLEEDLGTKLFVRSKSGVQLTAAGQKFQTHAQELLQHWQNIRARTLKEEEQVAGRYTIGAHPSVAIYSFTPILKSLLTKYPLLEFRFEHDLSRRIADAVIQFKIDFAVVVNPTPHPDLVINEVCTDEVTYYIPADGHYCEDVLFCDENLLQAQEVLKKTKKTPFQRIISSTNLEFITAAVSQGAGAGILPQRVAQQSAKKLKRLPGGSWPIFKDKICLIYRRDMHMSHASQEFSQVLKNLINNTI